MEAAINVENTSEYLSATNGGGDFNTTMVMDIGTVNDGGIYVKSVTFYFQTTIDLVAWGEVKLDTDFFPAAYDGIDDFGIPYRTFPVERWFGKRPEVTPELRRMIVADIEAH